MKNLNSIMNFMKIGILLSGISLSTGCTYLQAQSRVDPRTVANYSRYAIEDKQCRLSSPSDKNANRLNDDTRSGAINLDCFRFPEDSMRGKEIPEDGKTAYALAVADVAGIQRNRLTSILIKHADDVCTTEMGRFAANEATVNASLSILTSGFAAASTIVSGELSKSILSGIATTTSASRAHINAEVYRNIVSATVNHAIQNERDRQKLQILAKNSMNISTYSVDQMIMDVNQYHQVCSFYRGLTLVNDAVDKQKVDPSDLRSNIDRAVSDLKNTDCRLSGPDEAEGGRY
ncbi:hypothetical protein [Sphingomonas crocodyli]|uniref:Lipoprotein n=1 Tax=Sphingomonas crocodyli TaxID=1979270 RepID=A0A437M9T0_9SPHN|nr:hypothetical protein [Sphingomonas crocodyli]RVT94294.1 hypothetical protein EOD43_10730 [Sphingomonas crocodyli]